MMEKDTEESVYTYNLVTLLYRRDEHSTVNQRQLNFFYKDLLASRVRK